MCIKFFNLQAEATVLPGEDKESTTAPSSDLEISALCYLFICEQKFLLNCRT